MSDTSGSTPAARRSFLPRYGIDAPDVPAATAVLGPACLAGSRRWRWLLVPAVALLAQLASFLHTTLRGKFRVWDRDLDRLELTGDERLLDIGCGRGAVLIRATQRLPAGRAVGIDPWRSLHQLGNDIGATRANAERTGTAGRIELHTGDMTELPFPDASFDVVTSALVVHNGRTAEARHRALDEALRVLRPGAGCCWPTGTTASATTVGTWAPRPAADRSGPRTGTAARGRRRA